MFFFYIFYSFHMFLSSCGSSRSAIELLSEQGCYRGISGFVACFDLGAPVVFICCEHEWGGPKNIVSLLKYRARFLFHTFLISHLIFLICCVFVCICGVEHSAIILIYLFLYVWKSSVLLLVSKLEDVWILWATAVRKLHK